MHYKFMRDCTYFICYFEQNGCGKTNTGEVTPDTQKKKEIG